MQIPIKDTSGFRLSFAKRAYYQLRSLFPKPAKDGLRRIYQKKSGQGDWFIDDAVIKAVDQKYKLRGASVWPHGRKLAFVITHDVEGVKGYTRIPDLAAIDSEMGFCSSFNIVAEEYPYDPVYLAELRTRGFEIGLHGLKHDGKLFFSQKKFREQGIKINEYVRKLKVAGFRSPLTHRHPIWMQQLAIEYDSSFFDVDPFESMPGGVRWIWPFRLGKFIELPYTLPQDNTLYNILSEQTADIWKKKIDFIEHWHGMALINVHPDYLNNKYLRSSYIEFLEYVKSKGNYWNVLPRDLARWWKENDPFKKQLKLNVEYDLR